MTETEKQEAQTEKGREPAQKPEKAPEEKPIQKPEAEKSAGFCVYIGPSKIGVIKSNTIYKGTRREVLALPEIRIARKKYPEVADFIVDGLVLAEQQKKKKTKGEALYQKYKHFAER